MKWNDKVVLVTGGTGFIGSETVIKLIENGYEAVIVDNLSNSKKSVLGRIEKITGVLPTFYQADVADEKALREVFEKEKFEDEDALMDIVLEAGAEDMKAEDDVFEITAEPGDFNAVEAALAEKGIETASAEITMVPDTTVHLEGKDAQKMLDLIDAFEESDDVQNVYANYEIDEDSLEG